jgi:hypothetical protein
MKNEIMERFAVDVPATDTFRAKPKDSDSPSVSPTQQLIENI